MPLLPWGLCSPGRSTCAALKRGGVCPAEGELRGAGALAQPPDTGDSFGISTCETVPPVGSLQVTAVLRNVRGASWPSHCCRLLPVLCLSLCFCSCQLPSVLERPRRCLLHICLHYAFISNLLLQTVQPLGPQGNGAVELSVSAPSSPFSGHRAKPVL